MSPLHGLRLNCILAPLVAAVVGAAAVVLSWSWHADAQAELRDASDRRAVAGLAIMLEHAPSTPLSAWLEAHRAWRGVARVQVRDGLVTEMEHAGEAPVPREAAADLMLAYQAPRIVAAGSAVAAPCLHEGGSSLVIAWRAPAPAAAVWPWLALAAGVVAIGGGLGAYLVRRVYRPVEWMQRAAEAATRGDAEPPDAPDGPETASLRSSIATLISQRRHSDLADDHA